MGVIEVVYKGLIIVINSTYGADASAILALQHIACIAKKFIIATLIAIVHQTQCTTCSSHEYSATA